MVLEDRFLTAADIVHDPDLNPNDTYKQTIHKRVNGSIIKASKQLNDLNLIENV